MKAYAALITLVLKLLTMLGLYAKGRGDEAAKARAKADQTYIKQRKAADDADLGIGASDAERIDRLRRFADE